MLGVFLHLWQMYGRGCPKPDPHTIQHIVCHFHHHRKICTIKL